MGKRVLDLTNLDKNLTRKLNIIAKDAKSEYTNIIDEISKQFSENDNWWCTNLAARHTEQGGFFYDYCLLKLAIEELKDSTYDLIIVDESVKKSILKQFVYIPIIIKRDAKKTLKNRMQMVREQYVLHRLKKRVEIIKANNNPICCNKPISLIDTYVIVNQFSEGEFQDRYFDGLLEYANQQVFFFSQADFKKYSDGKVIARNLPKLKNYICMESFVERDDYKRINEYIKFCKKTKIKKTDKIVFAELFQQALKRESSNLNSMYAVLKQCALKRMIEKYEYKIVNIITWYEGQASSNGLIRTANKYGINTIAYVFSPMPEFNLGLSPSPFQVKKRVSANKYAIQGRAWLNTVCQFHKVETIFAPSFRYKKIFENDVANKKDNEGNILVVLPGGAREASEFLNTMSYVCKNLKLNRILVKNHPFLQKYTLNDYGLTNEMFGGCSVEFFRGSMEKALEKVKIAVISGSSATLEILLHGVEVICHIQQGTLSHLCIPEKYLNEIEIAYNEGEIIKGIIKLKDKPKNIDKIAEIKELAFYPVDKNSVGNFENSW